MSLSLRELQKLLDVVRETQTVEIDCDVCLVQLGEFTEAHLIGKPVPQGLKAIEQHLSVCDECREEFESLGRALRELDAHTSSLLKSHNASRLFKEMKMSISMNSAETNPSTNHPTPFPLVWEDRLASTLQRAGTHLTRSGLVVVFLWIGGMKFTNYEAEGIRPFIENSPLMSWLYQIFSIGQFSALLGVAEIVVGLLIASRYFWPKLSALGSLVAATMFVGTLTFIISTPGWEPTLGFPALSVPGQFLLKDAVLLGAAVWTAGEAWQAASCRARTR